MNKELLEAMEVLEKEKNISKDTLIEAIENSLLTACKNHFGKADNVKVTVNPNTCDFAVYAEKAVVENVEDDCLEMSLADAKMLNPKYEIGDTVQIPLDSKKFGRIATQNAKNVILQKIREEERKALYNEYYMKEKDVMTGVVQRYLGRNVSINLGRVDAILNESEQVKGETFRPTERVKVYVIEVKDTPKGPRVSVSRTHPDLVKRLFESEVAEVRDGTVEIKAIAREAGSRTKIAVKSNDANVDPVGACVGLNGSRVNSIVSELKGEKIDIINWDDNPAYLIENALSPAKVSALWRMRKSGKHRLLCRITSCPLPLARRARTRDWPQGLRALRLILRVKPRPGKWGSSSRWDSSTATRPLRIMRKSRRNRKATRNMKKTIRKTEANSKRDTLRRLGVM